MKKAIAIRWLLKKIKTANVSHEKETSNMYNCRLLEYKRTEHGNNTNYIGILKRFEVGHEQDISDRKRFSFYAICIIYNARKFNTTYTSHSKIYTACGDQAIHAEMCLFSFIVMLFAYCTLISKQSCNCETH